MESEGELAGKGKVEERGFGIGEVIEGEGENRRGNGRRGAGEGGR